MDSLLLLAEAAASAVPAATSHLTSAADSPAATAAVVSSGERFMLLLTIFVLAVYVGTEIISRIPPTLHTPLMSGSNAISGITLLGAMLASGADNGWWSGLLGVTAVALATINVVGGFVVTHRMLKMFRTKK